MNIKGITEASFRNLDEAFKNGAFTGSMSRWELIERIEKKNPNLRVFSTATHRSLWVDNKFILGIAHLLNVPKINLFSSVTGRFLARGWDATFKLIRQAGFEVDDEDLC